MLQLEREETLSEQTYPPFLTKERLNGSIYSHRHCILNQPVTWDENKSRPNIESTINSLQTGA